MKGWADCSASTIGQLLDFRRIEFSDRTPAQAYYEKFMAAMATAKPYSYVKFYTFVITKDNFNIFYRTKALDEYLTFFDRNYQAKNP